MRPRKPKAMKKYDYFIPREAGSTWTEILVSSAGDDEVSAAEDAAADAAEAYCKANPEKFPLFQKGEYVTVRLSGGVEEYTFEILMQSITEYVADNVTLVPEAKTDVN